MRQLVDGAIQTRSPSDSGGAISAYRLGRVRDDLLEKRNDVLLGSWAGTALAGGLFGLLMVVWEMVFGEDLTFYSPSFSEVLREICNFIALGAFAFFVGCLWAGFVALVVIFFTWVILKSLGTQSTPLWIASCIGAWTAFFCCGECDWVAIILGQLGATACAIKVLKLKTQRIFKASRPTPAKSFGLGQLFRVMTVLCFLLGAVGILKPNDRFLIEASYCLLWQSVVVCLVTMLIKSRATRDLRCT